MALVLEATTLPSIGADQLLRDLGEAGVTLAESVNYRAQHSGRPVADFPGAENFKATVSGHLAPIFSYWAEILDRQGILFSRQWEWEAVCLARQKGLSLRLNAHFDHHYGGGVWGPALAINDRLSSVLRSAYLRALHWCIDEGALEVDSAEIHARRVGVMADPVIWGVRPSLCPDWWPRAMSGKGGLDLVGETVGQAVRNRLEIRDSDEPEILLFAAGPVGNDPRAQVELVVRAFLQSAHGPTTPQHEELAHEIPWIGCYPVPPRLSLPGTYMSFEKETSAHVRDWLVAPLAWRLLPGTETWILPDRQMRGLYMPATWLLPGSPSAYTESSQVCVALDKLQVARFRYWNDELRERHYSGAVSRVGVELLIRKEWLAPQVALGATLCWIATLSVVQRGEYEKEFSEPKVVGNWLFGGSHVVRPEPWHPRSPTS